MKISVIITALLFTQVSASFFDVFHGAVLSVQNSFGKLLSDVVTDVKDTVDCTILAVEHVLSLSEDATIRYYDKCGQGTNQTSLQNDPRQIESLPKVELSIKFPDTEQYLQKTIPSEIDTRINQTFSKVIEDYKPHDNLLSIEKVLAKESEQLADVSSLVKKEMKKLASEVTADLEHIKQKDSGPSAGTILKEKFKDLEKREQNAGNASEAIEIHQIVDKGLDKLDAIKGTEANENVKLEEILRDLENTSNNGFLGLRQQFKEWKEEESRHLSEIKDKIEEHEKMFNNSNKMYDSYHTQSILISKDKLKNTEPVLLSQGILKVQIAKAEESLDITTRRISNAEVTENPYESGLIQDSKNTAFDRSVTNNRFPTTPTNAFGNNRQFLDENIAKKLPINTRVSSLETLVVFNNQNVIATTTSIPNVDSNDITSTSNPRNPTIQENTIDSKAVQKIETSSASGGEDLATLMSAMIHRSNDSNNTDAVIENVTSQYTEGVIGSTTDDFVSTTEIITTESNVFDPRNILATSTPTPISTSPKSIDAIVTTTTASLFEPTTFISSESMISNISSSIETTTISEVLFYTNTSLSEIEEPSKLTTNSPIASTAKILITDSNAHLISTVASITGSTVASETLQPVIRTTTTANEPSTGTDTTTPMHVTEPGEILSIKNIITRSEEEELTHDPITLDTDSTPSLITSTPKITEIFSTTNEEKMTLTPEIVSEINDNDEPVENKTITEKKLKLHLDTTHAPLASRDPLMYTDSNDNNATTTTTPIPERSLSTEILPSVTNTSPTTNEEFSTLTLSDSNYNTNGITSYLQEAEHTTATALHQPDEITPPVDNDVSILPEDDIATSTAFTTAMNENTTEMIEIVESTTVASEIQEPNDLTTNNTVISSIALTPLKENRSSIEVEITTAQEILSTTPKIILNHHFTISSSPLVVTDGPPILHKVPLIDLSMIPVNKPWLTPRSVDKVTSNKMSEQSYNIPRAPKMNNDFPHSLTDGLINSRWPLYDPHQVYNGPQKIDGIVGPTGKFSPQLQNPMLPDHHGRKNNFITNRFSDVGAIPLPMNHNTMTPGLIPTVPKRPSPAEINAHDKAVMDQFNSMINSGWPFSSMDPDTKNTPNPRVPTDRGRMNTPEHALRSPYNRYRPRGLTTFRPPNKARTDDIQNTPLDYDSFFNNPQKNPEVHQRALKDAQQLIAKSQLSNRIINRLLQTKNNVGARSLFNSPRTLNSGK